MKSRGRRPLTISGFFDSMGGGQQHAHAQCRLFGRFAAVAENMGIKRQLRQGGKLQRLPVCPECDGIGISHFRGAALFCNVCKGCGNILWGKIEQHGGRAA